MKELIEELISLFCLEDSIARERAEKLLKEYVKNELNNFVRYLNSYGYSDESRTKDYSGSIVDEYLKLKPQQEAFDESIKKALQYEGISYVFVSPSNYQRLKGEKNILPNESLKDNEIKIEYK